MSGVEPYALLRMKKANDEAARLAREEGELAPCVAPPWPATDFCKPLT